MREPPIARTPPLPVDSTLLGPNTIQCAAHSPEPAAATLVIEFPMPSTWLHPAVVFLLALVWTVPSSSTVSPHLQGQQPEASLAGDLLVASPHIRDPRFWHTVIAIVEQNDRSAIGIVINRPLATVPVARLLQAFGLDDAGANGTIRIFAGGPVGPTTCFVLHSIDYHRPGTIEIDHHLALTANPEVLEDIARGHGPKKKLVAFGYAGWAPGQLQMELGRGDWYIIPETSKLVFDDQRDHVWDDAMASRTTQL
ncbi:MAG: YqgE/AlgH family protein [Acetobacteraceae bacterium]